MTLASGITSVSQDDSTPPISPAIDMRSEDEQTKAEEEWGKCELLRALGEKNPEHKEDDIVDLHAVVNLIGDHVIFFEYYVYSGLFISTVTTELNNVILKDEPESSKEFKIYVVQGEKTRVLVSKIPDGALVKDHLDTCLGGPCLYYQFIEEEPLPQAVNPCPEHEQAETEEEQKKYELLKALGKENSEQEVDKKVELEAFVNWIDDPEENHVFYVYDSLSISAVTTELNKIIFKDKLKSLERFKIYVVCSNNDTKLVNKISNDALVKDYAYTITRGRCLDYQFMEEE
ncbi:hypothetical protein COEREDRAFT_85832 [Coemansia reversa NRRL 1564]|uniref:Uncharacterized protein n=1 Tax=Coemansia reversa (strain ATCC 12441 / NRRL 1564) TaxID=763665 RepID=A0A2G5BG16_COERN|nr:hypothetical protein COEREDRAFT_85832 [Coemansia reversa NRRL 1564]|eukprot:PIA17968.1 hypothetical protein COEREDRAFT_85832 [Coemansia reversa NRRL 1564]